jgi:hypothetical protein
MNRSRYVPLDRDPLHAPGPGSSPAGDGHGGQPVASTHGFAPSRPFFPLTPFKRMALWSHFAWVTVLSTVMLFCCLFLLIFDSSDFHHIAVRPRQCVISGTENPWYDLTAGFLWFHSTASGNSSQLFTHTASSWSSRTCDEELCFQNVCNVAVSFTRGTAMTLLLIALSQLWSLGIVYQKFTWKRQLPLPLRAAMSLTVAQSLSALFCCGFYVFVFLPAFFSSLFASDHYQKHQGSLSHHFEQTFSVMVFVGVIQVASSWVILVGLLVFRLARSS